jgi:hypothetical protein
MEPSTDYMGFNWRRMNNDTNTTDMIYKGLQVTEILYKNKQENLHFPNFPLRNDNPAKRSDIKMEFCLTRNKNTLGRLTVMAKSNTIFKYDTL